MTQERGLGDHIVAVLVTGFALLVCLLAGAVYISIQEMELAESNAVRLLEQGRSTAILIETIHRDEDSLNGIFYKLAAGNSSAARSDLVRSLDAVQQRLRTTIEAGMASDTVRWQRIKVEAEAFLREGRKVLEANGAPNGEFYRKHEALNEAVASLATSKFDSDAEAERSAGQRFRGRLRYTVALLGCALVVAISGAALTVYVTYRVFERTRWQSAELSRLSSRVMSDLDALARRFSHELHDQFGQTLNAIEANLVAMRNRREYSAERIEDCLGLIKDGMSSVREVSQLLRPSILDDFGLDASLRWLTEMFSERNGIKVEYTSSFTDRMNTEVETQVFRIAQEALTNVGRHSRATEVQMELARVGGVVRLRVSDNGRGFEPATSEAGLGLVGMRARARTARGILVVNSKAGRGVSIQLEVPFVPEAA